MRIIALSIIVLVLAGTVTAQQQPINGDYKNGVLNIGLPKTPESQGFEKYGNIPVNDVTGTANFSIPIYTVKSRFLELPISLNYNASGIKVNQEASWVGLGFDLVAGGRITVDVRGTIDNDSITNLLFSPSQLIYGMQKIFTRLNPYSNYPTLTFASTCQGCDTNLNQNIPDDWASINAMAQYGLGEPDIFHANFGGQSINFYYDKISGSLKFIGEKSLVGIISNKDAYNRITDWIVTDNMGVKYFFTQKEKTTLSMPPYGTFYGNSSTTGWLLTKILHPSGDSLKLSYSNYGSSYPAFTWSASTNSMSGASNDAYQNYVIQSPMYLTKIESNDVVVDIILGNRTDLRGTGSKKVDEIRISDKQTGALKRKIGFSYGYFTSTQPSCYTNSLPDSLKNYSLLRLKLNKIFLNDSALLVNPYLFYYYGNVVPDKYSFSQDHWGFYNGASNNFYPGPCSPQNLIPHFDDAIPWKSGTEFTEYKAFVANSQVYNADRNCSALLLPVMTLDSVVYPTGGSSKFVFEPHSGMNGLIGGGLRIKQIKNYSLSKFAGSTEYSYDNGIYTGIIRYQTLSYAMERCWGYPGPDKTKGSVSSNGILNDNDYVIAYEYVTETQKDASGTSNGFLKKRFKIPSNNTYMSLPAHWPTVPPNVLATDFMFPESAAFPPTAIQPLDGKLIQEEYFDNLNNKLKSVNRYYSQADFSSSYYSLRAIDNRIGGSDAYGCPDGYQNQEFQYNGARRYTVFLSPMKSYYTILDSVIENNFQGAQMQTTKKYYKYNSFFQPEYEGTSNADGTQTIAYTKLLSAISNSPLNYPLSCGDYQSCDLLMNMRLQHIFELPIEKALLKRSANGDTTVLGSKFIYYKPNTQAFKTYALENQVSIAYRSGFVPAYYNTADFKIKIDNGYKFQDSAIFSSASLITDAKARKGFSSYIWDDLHNNLLAQCTNASSGDIAYSSFEVSTTGGWSYTGSTNDDFTAVTGTKTYSLSGGNITKSGLSSIGQYIVSYWSKNGLQTISNSTASISGRTVSGWTYYEHVVSNPSSGVVTISGTGTIDELRLYPKIALMVSYCYLPVVGLTSQCDANNRISYYEYDALNRLTVIRDQDKYILKKICYNYAGQQENCSGWGNQVASQTFTRANSFCATDYAGTTGTYTVPANRYFSNISQSDANAQAQADISLNGQNYVNTDPGSGATCIPMVKSTNTTTTPFTIAFTNTSTSQVSTFTAYPSSSSVQIGQVATGTYNIQVTPYSAITSQVTINGTTQTGSTMTFSNKAITGPALISINPVSGGSCSFTMNSGYTSPTNSISSSGGVVSFYITFYRSSTMTAGQTYSVATISSGCRPSSARTINYTTGGRSWTITIYPTGQMTWLLNTGSPNVPANTTISTSTLTYNL